MRIKAEVPVDREKIQLQHLTSNIVRRYTNSIPAKIFTAVDEEDKIFNFIEEVRRVGGIRPSKDISIIVTIAELRKLSNVKHNSSYNPELYYEDLIAVLSKDFNLFNVLTDYRYYIELIGKSIKIIKTSYSPLDLKEYINTIKKASKAVEILYNKRQIENIKENCKDLKNE